LIVVYSSGNEYANPTCTELFLCVANPFDIQLWFQKKIVIRGIVLSKDDIKYLQFLTVENMRQHIIAEHSKDDVDHVPINWVVD
jgi:hypothetical protein